MNRSGTIVHRLLNQASNYSQHKGSWVSFLPNYSSRSLHFKRHLGEKEKKKDDLLIKQLDTKKGSTSYQQNSRDTTQSSFWLLATVSVLGAGGYAWFSNQDNDDALVEFDTTNYSGTYSYCNKVEYVANNNYKIIFDYKDHSLFSGLFGAWVHIVEVDRSWKWFAQIPTNLLDIFKSMNGGYVSDNRNHLMVYKNTGSFITSYIFNTYGLKQESVVNEAEGYEVQHKFLTAPRIFEVCGNAVGIPLAFVEGNKFVAQMSNKSVQVSDATNGNHEVTLEAVSGELAALRQVIIPVSEKVIGSAVLGIVKIPGTSGDLGIITDSGPIMHAWDMNTGKLLWYEYVLPELKSAQQVDSILDHPLYFVANVHLKDGTNKLVVHDRETGKQRVECEGTVRMAGRDKAKYAPGGFMTSRNLVIDRTGDYIIAGGTTDTGGQVMIWEIATGKKIGEIECPNAVPVAFVSKESGLKNSYIVAGLSDGSLQFIDLSSGKSIAHYKGWKYRKYHDQINYRNDIESLVLQDWTGSRDKLDYLTVNYANGIVTKLFINRDEIQRIQSSAMFSNFPFFYGLTNRPKPIVQDLQKT